MPEPKEVPPPSNFEDRKQGTMGMGDTPMPKWEKPSAPVPGDTRGNWVSNSADKSKK